MKLVHDKDSLTAELNVSVSKLLLQRLLWAQPGPCLIDEEMIVDALTRGIEVIETRHREARRDLAKRLSESESKQAS